MTDTLSAVTTMPIKEMYDISTRQNAAWGIEGYEVPRDYLDSKRLAEIKEKKEVKPAPRALAKGDYLTETLRATKGIPGPNSYNIIKPWFPVDKIKKDAPKVGNKNTFLDQIAKNKTPGPGAYDLRKSDKQIEEEKKVLASKNKSTKSERVFFLSEVEYVANMYPGPGMYNPREIDQTYKHTQTMDPDKWRKKHQEERKKNGKSNMPDCGSYNPVPVNIMTFDKLKTTSKESNKAKTWGTSERFSKIKKDAYNPPGPGHYNTNVIWNGKPEGKKGDGDSKKDKNWMNKLTKGIEKSIYYS